MAKSKKIVAIILALVLSFSIVAVPVAAGSAMTLSIGGGSAENFLYLIIDRLVEFLLSYFNKYWPGFEDKWDTVEDYTAEHFFPGEETFDTEVAPGSEWSLGYAGASLIKDLDIMNGEFYLAGTLEPIAGRVPVEVVDDQRVRVYALSDGVSGTVVHAVIDGFGFSRGNVEEIRSRLESFAAANDIVSINVSVLHQHSCIDTLGMNVPLAPAVILNTSNAALDGKLEEFMVKKNPEFMENLFSKTVASIKKAVRNMESGDLYYGAVDVSEYIHDKRTPEMIDGNLTRLRFVPDNTSSKETWIAEAGIHPTTFGAGTDRLTADFPYYIEQYVNKEYNANLVYIQGAELAISKDTEPLRNEGILTDDSTDLEVAREYGYALGEKLTSLNGNETLLDPVLNIKHKEIYLDVDNEILTLATREGILDAVIVKDGDGYKMVTEIGYMELGNELGVFLVPGEMDPVIIFGNATTSEESWTGQSWGYAPLKEFTGLDNVCVFGLCNDQAGYILTDNEYRSIIDNNEEVNIVSRTSASTMVEEFMALIGSVK